MAIPFARSSTPDTARASVWCGRGLQAAAPAIGCCAVTCRSRTPQIARKANALKGCNKNWRSRRCAPWHRRITTTGVARLAIIQFLLATRFMADLIRGSLGHLEVFCTAHHIPICGALALQLDAQAQVVHRVGVFQGILVGDHAGFVQGEQRAVEGLHAQFA